MSNQLPAFHFQVDWGGTRIGFTEVSGHEVEIATIEYRDGSSPENSMTKMPGLAKYQNITLKRGVTLHDNEFFEWLKTVRLDQAERRDITISLLNQDSEPVMVWRVRNAWPVRLAGPTLDAMASKVAIEELEIAHEGLTVENQ